nr:uncharacterized protein LOC107442993 [Parasteatoda tepidariorum]XP_042910491.1 uncharacterized protein LOC107442993 [Parasteatoda tepidariorum]
MRNLLMVIFVSGFLPPALLLAQRNVLFASLYDDQNLATRINCQVEEEQHFRYVSESSLWDSMGGKIFTEADILLRCLGADLDGKYGSAALKYNVEISNLKMSEGTQRKRRKRGARDFFSNSWKKVKNLFNRLLGRCHEDVETNRASSSGDDIITDDEPDEVSAAELYTVPFQLVQLANGSIPEIRFSENEVEDGRVKNFKRHLADAFATRLLLHHRQGEVERSVMGEHTSTYNISISGNKKSNYNVAGLTSTSQPPEIDKTVIVVNKMVTTDDIVRFAPSDALNDKERMDLRSEQMQMFNDGRMTVCRGISTLSMVTSHGVKKRKKRGATEDDATFYIRTQTSFDLQLRRRRRRSAEDPIRREEKHYFKAASRVAEVETDLRKKKKQLSDFQESVDLNFILDDLISGREMDTDDNKIQSLSELLKQEITLNLDKEENSLCNAIRRKFTLQIMKEMCDANFSVCKDNLHLVALAGSSPAEEIFLHFLGKSSSLETTHQQQIVADILSDISRPSPQLLMKLGEIVSGGESAVGALPISLGHLASSAEPGVKNRISDLFSDLLLDKECDGDPDLMDLLEAVGNLKCDRITPRILEVSLAIF